MTEDYDRAAWLAALKPGDKVAVDSRRGYTLTEVARKTPSGMIITNERSDGWRYDKDGRHRYDSWSTDRLVPITPRIEDEIFRKRAIYELSTTAWRHKSTAKLRAILAVLESEQAE